MAMTAATAMTPETDIALSPGAFTFKVNRVHAGSLCHHGADGGEGDEGGAGGGAGCDVQ